MGSIDTGTWVEKLEEWLNVDVDTMDQAVAKALPFTPHNMTSNQGIVYLGMCSPEGEQILRDAVAEMKGEGWEAILARVSARLCAANIGNIQGRVLLQTSPFQAYSTEIVLEQARRYAREFEKVGISKDRFCIKIPSTGPALNACPILLKEGIRTLGTSLYSVAQAIAASQAGCLYISPYLNEPHAHTDPSIWPNVEDPATQLPMSARIIQILETYKQMYQDTGKQQPLVKLASFISVQECMAAGELGCHHATIPGHLLQQLSELQYDSSKQPGEGVPKPTSDQVYKDAGPTPRRLAHLSKTDLLSGAKWDGKVASTKINYLANNGAELEKAIEADQYTKTRLFDALEDFQASETRCRVKIEEAMKANVQ